MMIMSKVSLALLKQRSAAVESCVDNIECAYSSYYGDNEEVEELRNNWDLLYTMILDLHENLQDFIGEIEE